MRCEELMKTDVHCVTGDETAEEAARRMRDLNVGFLPICENGSNRVVGTITDRDLAVRVLADGIGPDTPVSTIMTREVVWCEPSDDLKRAQELMAEHHKSRMLCVDEQGELQGVISLSDLAEVADRDDVVRALRGISEREARA